MKRARLIVLSVLAAGLCAGLGWAATAPRAVATAPASAALGRWLTQSGNLEIEIAPCGSTLCGTVVAVRANRSMEDPRKAMQPVDGRPPMGMRILTDFVAAGDGSWEGRIYNRENGKTYDCRVTPLAGDRLLVRGYKLIPMVGRDQTWTRVAEARAAAGAR